MCPSVEFPTPARNGGVYQFITDHLTLMGVQLLWILMRCIQIECSVYAFLVALEDNNLCDCRWQRIHFDRKIVIFASFGD